DDEEDAHMLRKIAVGTIGALAILALVASGAAAQSKCSGSKAKAAGKKALAKLGCLSKAVSKGTTPVDSTCLAKAEVKFSVAYAKAEAKVYTDAGCITFTDVSAIEGKVDTLLSDIDALVGDGPNNCDSQKVKAAGKKANAKLGCVSKAITKGFATVD